MREIHDGNCQHEHIEWFFCQECEVSDERHMFPTCLDCGADVEDAFPEAPTTILRCYNCGYEVDDVDGKGFCQTCARAYDFGYGDGLDAH